MIKILGIIFSLGGAVALVIRILGIFGSIGLLKEEQKPKLLKQKKDLRSFF